MGLVVRMAPQWLISSQLDLIVVSWKLKCSRTIATKKSVSATQNETGVRCRGSCPQLKLVNSDSAFCPTSSLLFWRSPSWTVTPSPSDDNHLISTSDCRTAAFTLGKDSFSLLTSQEPISFPNQLKRKNRRAQCDRGKRKLFWLAAPGQVTQPHMALGIEFWWFCNAIRGQDRKDKVM